MWEDVFRVSNNTFANDITPVKYCIKFLKEYSNMFLRFVFLVNVTCLSHLQKHASIQIQRRII